MGMLTDADAVLDVVELFDFRKDYAGGDAQSSAIDLGSKELPKSAALLLYTENGSAGDTVDIDLQDAADDGTGSPDTWADAVTDIPTLDDATDEKVHVLDLADRREHIRLDYASGDQTVGASIDVIVAIVAVGSEQSQAL